MTENITFAKIISGETIMGIKDEEAGVIKDIVMVQAMPTQTGSMQIAILPYGFPFEDEVRGEIKLDHVLFEYKEVPGDLTDKYIETKSNIKIANNMGGLGNPGSGGSSDSGLIL
jgi:hypothetical protein